MNLGRLAAFQPVASEKSKLVLEHRCIRAFVLSRPTLQSLELVP